MPVIPPSAPYLVRQFEQFCIDAHAVTPADVAERARALGWQPVTPPRGLSAAAQTTDGSLKVVAGETVSADERLESCSVMTRAPLGTLAAAVETATGVKPAFAMAGSATFLTYRDAAGWHPAPSDRAAFGRVKAAGEVYSLVVTDGEHGSGIVALNPRPNAR